MSERGKPKPDDPTRTPSGGMPKVRELTPWQQRGLAALSLAKFASTLFLFLVSLQMMGAAFKLFGSDFSKWLLTTTSNPFVGLFVGILSTSIVQSSSATTSMVVMMVGGGTLSVANAVPIIMGANIGTTVTCALVSLGHMTRREEFRRAMSGALVHDFFNLLAVALLLPVELVTARIWGKGVLERLATGLTGFLSGAEGVEYKSPLKSLLKWVAKLVVGPIKGWCGDTPGGKVAAGVIVLVIALALLFTMLYLMTRIMRRVLRGRAEKILDQTIGRSAILGMVVGMLITAIVQSSSATTSLLVPLAGAGILTVEQIFPITLGANVGTTVTALLASLAAGPAGLTIALVHLLFNASGILMIYPVPQVRRLPIRAAKWMAGLAAESKRYAFGFILGLFFVVPGLLILVSKLLNLT
ncbi:MAG: Na/Pi symporter [Planctomycetota bacterium]|jgi:sodium-dependent phosphate cotransporter